MNFSFFGLFARHASPWPLPGCFKLEKEGENRQDETLRSKLSTLPGPWQIAEGKDTDQNWSWAGWQLHTVVHRICRYVVAHGLALTPTGEVTDVIRVDSVLAAVFQSGDPLRFQELGASLEERSIPIDGGLASSATV